MRAYILVHFAQDADLSKVHHALRQPGIISVDMVMGPYDAIASCEVNDFEQLGELAKRVRSCPGLSNSITCSVV